MPKVSAPEATSVSTLMLGPPGLIGDVEAARLVEALGLGDVDAGELGLRHPFQPDRDAVGGRGGGRGGADWAQRRRQPPPGREVTRFFLSW